MCLVSRTIARFFNKKSGWPNGWIGWTNKSVIQIFNQVNSRPVFRTFRYNLKVRSLKLWLNSWPVEQDGQHARVQGHTCVHATRQVKSNFVFHKIHTSDHFFSATLHLIPPILTHTILIPPPHRPIYIHTHSCFNIINIFRVTNLHISMAATSASLKLITPLVKVSPTAIANVPNHLSFKNTSTPLHFKKLIACTAKPRLFTVKSQNNNSSESSRPGK